LDRERERLDGTLGRSGDPEQPTQGTGALVVPRILARALELGLCPVEHPPLPVDLPQGDGDVGARPLRGAQRLLQHRLRLLHLAASPPCARAGSAGPRQATASTGKRPATAVFASSARAFLVSFSRTQAIPRSSASLRPSSVAKRWRRSFSRSRPRSTRPSASL